MNRSRSTGRQQAASSRPHTSGPIGPANQRYINAGSSTPPSKGPRWPLILLAVLLLAGGAFLLATRLLASGPEIPEGYAWSGTSDTGYMIRFASLEDEGEEYPHCMLIVLNADGSYADSFVGHWVDRGRTNPNATKGTENYGFVTDTESRAFHVYDWASGSVGSDMEWNLFEYGKVSLKTCDADEVLRAARDAGVDVDDRLAAPEAGVADPSSWKGAKAWFGEDSTGSYEMLYAESADDTQACKLIRTKGSTDWTDYNSGALLRGADPEENKASGLILILNATPDDSENGFTYDSYAYDGGGVPSKGDSSCTLGAFVGSTHLSFQLESVDLHDYL